MQDALFLTVSGVNLSKMNTGSVSGTQLLFWGRLGQEVTSARQSRDESQQKISPAPMITFSTYLE